jgi:hypothetical protein
MENNASWFRNAPHYWPTAALPLSYAMACVEVVSKKSDKARCIYHQIIESWNNPGVKAFYNSAISYAPKEELEKVKQAFIHPEIEFFPDPNIPLIQMEEVFQRIGFRS